MKALLIILLLICSGCDALGMKETEHGIEFYGARWLRTFEGEISADGTKRFKSTPYQPIPENLIRKLEVNQ